MPTSRPRRRRDEGRCPPSRYAGVFELRAVITIAIGEEFRQIAAMTHPLIEAYARRIGADFISLHGDIAKPWQEKFRLFDFLELYDRVLFLDTDVIVKPDCPDLFELVPLDDFGAWLTSRHGPRFDPLIARIQEHLPDLGWRKTYFNSGVLVVSRQHRDAFVKTNEYQDEQYEQTLLNYRIQKLGYRIFDIGYRFNHTGVASQIADRFASHILHYAGTGRARVDLIRSDLRHLRLLPSG